MIKSSVIPFLVSLALMGACATPRTEAPRSLRAEVARARAETMALRTKEAENARSWRAEADQRGHGPRIEVDERVERRAGEALDSFVDASAYRGRVVEISTRLRSLSADSNARLWLRVSTATGRSILYDDMVDAPVRSPDWTPITLAAAIAPEAARIEFGVILDGTGSFGVDDVTLTSVRDLAPTDPPLLTQLTRRQIEDPVVKSVHLRSELLSKFWGRDIHLGAAVVLPPDLRDGEALPVVYTVPDFGGSWTDAYTEGALAYERMRAGHPRLVLVYLDPMCRQGHHAFVDSVNTGPWGEALVSELIPALEARSFAGRAPKARFVTGVGHGGWSSLWLQVTYPHLFDGAWAVAPTPVDFREFFGVDVYASADFYRDAAGDERPFVREGGKWLETLRGFVRTDVSRDPIGGWMASFDALASPRGDDGRPMPLFDRGTGRIDPYVARSWRARDLSAILRERWDTLGPKLNGKLHLWVGENDTYRCEAAVRRLEDDLRSAGAKIDVLVVPGRGRFDLGDPDPVAWPYGVVTRVHREMAARAGAAILP